MAYIGYNPSQLAVAPFATKYFTGDGSTTTFTLDQSVPGANEANVEVVVENVQQNPVDAYTIGGALNNSLIFSEAPANGAAIYVIHKGEATYNLQPSTGSVTAATLDPVLRNFTVNTFTGNGSTTTYTLTDTPYSANSILVTVDGITQTASTNYTVSGTTLDFGASAPDSGSVITVVHLGFSSGNKAVMDGSITPVKLSTGGPAWTTGGILAVGTTSPTSSSGTKLDVFSSTATISTAIRSTFSTGSAQLLLAGNNTTIGSGEFLISHDGSATAYLYNRSNTPMIFGTNNIERMRIDSAGKVGIGTSSPAEILDIQGSVDLKARVYTTGTTNQTHAGLTLKTGSYEYLIQNLTVTGGSTGAFRIYDINASAERLRIDNTGLLTLPYGQIKFPAVQNASSDANTLDDYEEGSWTPTVVGTSTNPSSVNYSTQFGKYTKIGNIVYLSFRVSFTFAGGSGAIWLTGLPYTVANNIQPKGALQQDNVTYTGFTYVEVGANQGLTSLGFGKNRSGSTASGLLLSDCATGGTDLNGGVYYFV